MATCFYGNQRTASGPKSPFLKVQRVCQLFPNQEKLLLSDPKSYNDLKCIFSSPLFVLESGELEQQEISGSFCIADVASNRVTRQRGTTIPERVSFERVKVFTSRFDRNSSAHKCTNINSHTHTPPNPPSQSLNQT